MENIMETKNLTKIYGTTSVVDHVNLHVPRGKIYGLLGRNGVGKTTVMKMLLKLIKVTKGSIYLFGEEFSNNEAYKRIGSMIETPGFYVNLTARDNLRLLGKLHGNVKERDVQRALEIVGLEKEEKKIFSAFSLGMKQRLGIAAAIMHQPEVLILDEPINGLDPIGIAEIRGFLRKLSREQGVSILISSHVLSEIEQIADMVGVMNQGRLIEEAHMAHLKGRLKQYIEIEVSDTRAAQKVLQNDLSIKDYTVSGETICIYDDFQIQSEINRCFVEQGILVSKLNLCEETLESYFENLIGGSGIG